MAARALHDSAGASKRKCAPRGKPFSKGNDPRRGTGQSKEDRAASDALRALAQKDALELHDSGVPRAIALLRKLFDLGFAGNVGAAEAYLDRSGLDTKHRVEVTGDVDLAIRRRVVNADSNG